LPACLPLSTRVRVIACCVARNENRRASAVSIPDGSPLCCAMRNTRAMQAITMDAFVTLKRRRRHGNALNHDHCLSKAVDDVSTYYSNDFLPK
jgi:hypothetical protein